MLVTGESRGRRRASTVRSSAEVARLGATDFQDYGAFMRYAFRGSLRCSIQPGQSRLSWRDRIEDQAENQAMTRRGDRRHTYP